MYECILTDTFVQGHKTKTKRVPWGQSTFSRQLKKRKVRSVVCVPGIHWIVDITEQKLTLLSFVSISWSRMFISLALRCTHMQCRELSARVWCFSAKTCQRRDVGSRDPAVPDGRWRICGQAKSLMIDLEKVLICSKGHVFGWNNRAAMSYAFVVTESCRPKDERLQRILVNRSAKSLTQTRRTTICNRSVNQYLGM